MRLTAARNPEAQQRERRLRRVQSAEGSDRNSADVVAFVGFVAAPASMVVSQPAKGRPAPESKTAQHIEKKEGYIVHGVRPTFDKQRMFPAAMAGESSIVHGLDKGLQKIRVGQKLVSENGSGRAYLAQNVSGGSGNIAVPQVIRQVDPTGKQRVDKANKGAGAPQPAGSPVAEGRNLVTASKDDTATFAWASENPAHNAMAGAAQPKGNETVKKSGKMNPPLQMPKDGQATKGLGFAPPQHPIALLEEGSKDWRVSAATRVRPAAHPLHTQQPASGLLKAVVARLKHEKQSPGADNGAPLSDAQLGAGEKSIVSDHVRPSAPPQPPPVSSGQAVADQARAIAAQIAQGVSTGDARVTEIALNPAELGKVRMKLRTSESGLHLDIAADRPEISNLLRRHIDGLVAEFQGMGFSDIGFTFTDSHQRSSHDELFPSRVDNSARNGRARVSARGTDLAIRPQSARVPGMQGGLDMRL